MDAQGHFSPLINLISRLESYFLNEIHKIKMQTCVWLSIMYTNHKNQVIEILTLLDTKRLAVWFPG